MHRLGQAAGEHGGAHREGDLVDHLAGPGPTIVAPMRRPPPVPRSRGRGPAISFTKPSVLPAAIARSTSDMGTKATLPPASTASASVSPTRAISGSQNVTHGTGEVSNARHPNRPSLAVALRTARRPISSAAWVNSSRPVTSPTAYTPVALVARKRSVRTRPRSSSSIPPAAASRPAVAGRRPTATSSASAQTLDPSERPEADPPTGDRLFDACHAGAEVHADPLRGEDAGQHGARLGFLAGKEPVLALDDLHLRSEAPEGLRQLAADGPAAEDRDRCGQLDEIEDRLVGEERDGVEPSDRRHGRAGTGGDHHQLRPDRTAVDR